MQMQYVLSWYVHIKQQQQTIITKKGEKKETESNITCYEYNRYQLNAMKNRS